MNGYLQLQRNFFSHSIWHEKREFSRAEAFLDMLQLAVFTRTKKIVKESMLVLEPGQLCGSIRFLAGRWGWGVKRVRYFLAMLEAEELITLGKESKRAHFGEVITILNYGAYKNVPAEKGTLTAHSRHTDGTLTAQIEEGEEGGKRKEGGISFARDGASSCPVPELGWSAEKGFAGITEGDRKQWAEAYPALDIASQLARAAEWLKANPHRRKKAVRRFITNWLARAQERGGDRVPNRPGLPGTAAAVTGAGAFPMRLGIGPGPLPPNAVVTPQGYIVRRAT
ncbi:hypothetical protein [Luteolibacter sp. Populi]|uniref:hypothetical protein n=1 Tax=Luteolibacter sp. Populi TaxID=3230487 RepID=UPI0034657EC4